jgi:hypothetical protein
MEEAASTIMRFCCFTLSSFPAGLPRAHFILSFFYYTNSAEEIHQKNAEYQRLTFEFNPELELHMPSDRRSWGAMGFLVLILRLDVYRKTPRNT